MIVDPWFYLAASVAVLVVGVAKGGLGGGIGVIAVPLMAMVISPVQAAAILLPILMVMDALALRAYWRLWDARYLRVLVPAALVGTALGFLTARSISADGLRILVAAVALAYAAVDVRRRTRSAGGPDPSPPGRCGARRPASPASLSTPAGRRCRRTCCRAARTARRSRPPASCSSFSSTGRR